MRSISRSVPAVVLGAFACLSLVASSPAVAGSDAEVFFDDVPTQGQLDSLTRELGASLSPPALAPAESLGAAHVDAGLSASVTSISASADYWKVAGGGERFPSTLLTPRATVRVGLPWRIDVGGSYVTVPSSNIELIGGEVKWAFLKGGPARPAVAARLAHSRLRGVDQLDLDATSLDLTASKGILFVTPYAGVGRLWLDSEVHGIDSDPGLVRRSSEGVNRVFAGARLSAGWFKTTLEAQRAAGVTTYALKLGFLVP